MSPYQLDRPQKAFCQIINNLHNEQKATRQDVDRLKNMYSRINVKEVQTRENLDKSELQQYSKDLELQNLKAFNIFFLIVLSHGVLGDMIQCRSGLFHIEDFVEAIGKNKTMTGYPKILIFDFCRGKDVNFGQLKGSTQSKIPLGSDIFIGFATSRGYYILQLFFHLSTRFINYFAVSRVENCQCLPISLQGLILI